MRNELNACQKNGITDLVIRKILVAADLTSHSDRTLDYASALAQLFGARILLLHVVDPSLFWAFPLTGMSDEPARIKEQLNARVSQIASTLSRNGVKCEAVMREGSTRSAIRAIIREEDIDLLVLGGHRPGSLRQLAFGSTFNAMIHEAACPVITVGPNVWPLAKLGPCGFERIIFAADFSPASVPAASYAGAFAAMTNTKLTVAHVRTTREWDSNQEDGEPNLRELIPTLKNIDFTEAPLNGDPVRALVKLSNSEHADLLVMAVKQASRAAVLLSEGMAHEVICRARCPVLTLAYEERQFVSRPAFVQELAGTLV